MKALVAAFNKEKALVGAFSVITNLRMELFQALELTHRWGWACTEDMFGSGSGKCRWSIARGRTSLSGSVSGTWTAKHNQLQYDVLLKLVLPSSHGSDRCFSYIMSPYIHSLISAGLKGVASACCIVHHNMPTSDTAAHCSSPVEGEAAGGAVHPGHSRQPGHLVRSVRSCGDKYYSRRKYLDVDIIHGENISGPRCWWRVCESAEHVATLNMSGHVADRDIASSCHGKHDCNNDSPSDWITCSNTTYDNICRIL